MLVQMSRFGDILLSGRKWLGLREHNNSKVTQSSQSFSIVSDFSWPICVSVDDMNPCFRHDFK